MDLAIRILSYIGAGVLALLIVYGVITSILSVTSYSVYRSPSEQIPERTLITPPDPTYEYIEVVNSCGPSFAGTCAHAYAGPGYGYEQQETLRNGVVLMIKRSLVVGNTTWYEVAFQEWVRYPERIKGTWYIPAEYARVFSDIGPLPLWFRNYPDTTTRHIVVDLSKQTLSAYDGDELFMQTTISTGLEDTPTPRGSFKIFKKTPTRYMQGPLPGVSSQYYDLPGVPWNLYFTMQGGAIHGAYWHNGFGHEWSHGCINMRINEAETLYHWADIGTPVYVHD